MTRGRQSEAEIASVAEIEGDLAVLGNARVYAQLIRERVEAARRMGSTEVLEVAIEDLRNLDALINRVQIRIMNRHGDVG